jgi:hypothetical protein
MASPKYYGQMFPYFDGELMSEATECAVSYEDDTQDVKTLAGEWSGVTPGPKMTVVTVTSMVPASDTMISRLQSAQLTNTFHEVGLQQVGNGDKLTGRMRVSSVSVTSGVGQNQSVSVEFRGEPAKFE